MFILVTSTSDYHAEPEYILFRKDKIVYYFQYGWYQHVDKVLIIKISLLYYKWIFDDISFQTLCSLKRNFIFGPETFIVVFQSSVIWLYNLFIQTFVQ